MVAEFSIVPIGEGEELAGLIAGIADLIDRSGLSYQLTAMGTIVEGDWDEILSLIKRCHVKMRESASRVYTSITIDDRDTAVERLKGKVTDVERVLGRGLVK
jgi:uncharacterized protein (TIGR00106 family)